MSNRAQLILIIGCVVGSLGFAGYQAFRATGTRTYAPDAAFMERTRLTEFASNGVRVAMFMESDAQGQPLLRATFTPTNQEFHLYSKDLDLRTTGGLGLPTRLELLPHASVKAAGRLFTDVPPQSHTVKELNATVDIYPDGPVTFRLPIRFVGTATTITAQVAVSYMACKINGECLFAVERQILDVRIQRPELPPEKAVQRTGTLLAPLQHGPAIRTRVVSTAERR